MFSVLRVLLLLAISVLWAEAQQDVVDYIAANIQPTFNVVTNFGNSPNSLQAEIEFNNVGEQPVTNGDWAIYFCHIRLLFPEYFRVPNVAKGVALGNTGLRVYHVNGCLYRILPTPEFVTFPAGQATKVPLLSSDWMVRK